LLFAFTLCLITFAPGLWWPARKPSATTSLAFFSPRTFFPNFPFARLQFFLSSRRYDFPLPFFRFHFFSGQTFLAISQMRSLHSSLVQETTFMLSFFPLYFFPCLPKHAHRHTGHPRGARSVFFSVSFFTSFFRTGLCHCSSSCTRKESGPFSLAYPAPPPPCQFVMG